MEQQNTYVVWVISAAKKETHKNLTKEQATAKYDELVQRYKDEQWNPIDRWDFPSQLRQFQKGNDMTIIGVIDTSAPPAPPRGVAHWLVRVPEKVVSHE